MSDLAQEIRDIKRRVARLEGLESVLPASGTYTPTYEGGTTPGTTGYAFQNGIYTIHGNIILVAGQINWSSATGTGEARISLPYTPSVGNWTGSLRLSGVTYANDTPQMLLSAGSLYFVMDSPLTNAAQTRVQMEAAGSVIWTVAYII